MMQRPQIPCGRVMGHGENCCIGRLCDHCEYILRLEHNQVEIQDDKHCHCNNPVHEEDMCFNCQKPI
jgi:hypothetical protein